MSILVHTWEVTASGAQRISNWRHGQGHVQVVGALADEILPDAFSRRTRAFARSLISHLYQHQL